MKYKPANTFWPYTGYGADSFPGIKISFSFC